jgi:hypothetical protein
VTLTIDWTADDITAYRAFCATIQAPLDVPVTVWANESDNRTTAHNPGGNASGLNQLMPETAKGLGYDLAADPELSAYRSLSVEGQLRWIQLYYAPFSGRLSTVARLYVATFLPAYVDDADDPSFVLCAVGGPNAWAYMPNRGFDVQGRGEITPADLEAAARRAVGPRTRELLGRISA